MKDSKNQHIADSMLSPEIIGDKFDMLSEQYAWELCKPESERDAKWLAYAKSRLQTLNSIKAS